MDRSGAHTMRTIATITTDTVMITGVIVNTTTRSIVTRRMTVVAVASTVRLPGTIGEECGASCGL